jgi:hypothetical protein
MPRSRPSPWRAGGGASLRAANWQRVRLSDGGNWDGSKRRRRSDPSIEGPKVLWELRFDGNAKASFDPLSVTICGTCGGPLAALQFGRTDHVAEQDRQLSTFGLG